MERTYDNEQRADELNKRVVDTLEKLDKDINALANNNGTPLVSFEDQRRIAEEIVKERGQVKARRYNPDGTVARTKVINAAVNVAAFFDNRYRVNKKKLEVVTAQTTDGWLAIEGQETGKVPYKTVDVYVFERKDEKLEYVGLAKVTDEEFIRDFTHSLKPEAMKAILELLPSEGGTAEQDDLPI